MRKEYLLGFDIGTYESKGTLTDLKGNIVATAVDAHIVRSPQPGFAEHDPIEDWWKGFVRIVRELFDKSGARPRQVAAIGISAIMAAITPVDGEFNPLRNAILYGIDTRCQKQADDLTQEIGAERILEISGAPLTVESFGPKIRWIRDHEPEVFERARHFTIAAGFMVGRLTGVNCVSHYSATSSQPMLDFKRMDWSEELAPFVCPIEKLPKIVRTVDVVGAVTKRAALETGLCEGTPVITGTTDAGAEAVSVGVVEPGDTMLMYGSTMFIVHLVDSLRFDAGLWPGPYVLDNEYSLTGGMATTGSLTRWVRDQFARDLLEKEKAGGENAYSALFREAEGIPPGAEGLVVLPYFQGERMPLRDPNARGVLFGLNLRHTRGHVVKAVFEGIGYGVDQNFDLLRRAGLPLGNVTAVGGGTKSPLWVQTISDVCGFSQNVPEVTIGACYGDALLAGLGIGSIAQPSDIKKIIKIRYSTTPNAEHHAAYADYKRYFAQLYERNRDIMHAL